MRVGSFARDLLLLVAAIVVAAVVETLVAGVLAGRLDLVSTTRDAIGTSILSLFYTPAIVLPAAAAIVAARTTAHRTRSARKGRAVGVGVAVIITALVMVLADASNVERGTLLFGVFIATALIAFVFLAPISVRERVSDPTALGTTA